MDAQRNKENIFVKVKHTMAWNINTDENQIVQ